jgi:hypothetical protein
VYLGWRDNIFLQDFVEANYLERSQMVVVSWILEGQGVTAVWVRTGLGSETLR